MQCANDAEDWRGAPKVYLQRSVLARAGMVATTGQTKEGDRMLTTAEMQAREREEADLQTGMTLFDPAIEICECGKFFRTQAQWDRSRKCGAKRFHWPAWGGGYCSPTPDGVAMTLTEWANFKKAAQGLSNVQSKNTVNQDRAPKMPSLFNIVEHSLRLYMATRSQDGTNPNFPRVVSKIFDEIRCTVNYAVRDYWAKNPTLDELEVEVCACGAERRTHMLWTGKALNNDLSCHWPARLGSCSVAKFASP